MCTVTYIPVKDTIFITSNRDEKRWRSQAIIPAFYAMETGAVIFPKDTDAGGTWFAVHENGNAVILLNGGWVNHIPAPPYRKSRGLVLLDIIDDDNPMDKFLTLNFNNIEPFTAVIVCEKKLYEYRWNGIEKSHRKLQADIPHIWSSVTLYDDVVIAKREKWFAEWLKKNPAPTRHDILSFHQFTGDGDSHNDLLMNRDDMVFTVSITSLERTGKSGILQYLDCKNQQTYRQEFEFSQAIMHNR
jgi:hypothetical protein